MDNNNRINTGFIRRDYLPVITGLLFVALGVGVVSNTFESYHTLSLYFGLTFLLTGINEGIFSLNNSKRLKGWGWSLAGALLSILTGLFILTFRNASAMVIPFATATLVMFRSVIVIAASLDLKVYKVVNWGNLLATGIVGLIFSSILVLYPVFETTTVIAVAGVSFLTMGVTSIYYGYKIGQLNYQVNSIPQRIMQKSAT